MSSIPNGLARVSNLMASRMALANINRSNVGLLRVSEQIATGRAVLRPSDDIIRAATISVLDDRLDRSVQLRRNLSHAAASLDVIDSALGAANDLAQQAKGIASQQLNVGSTASERASQAIVIDQMIQSLLNTANTQSVAGYVFGGSTTSRPPVEAFGTGFRYRGEGSGLITDLGQASGAPITIGATAISGISARVRGSVDLNPGLSPTTPLSDLNGARGLGVALGTVSLSIDGGAPITIDLEGAATADDVAKRIDSAVRQYESDNGVTILGPGGVGVGGDWFNIDVGAGHTLRFSDVGSGTAALDLGLTDTTPFDFTQAASAGRSTDPRLTLETSIGSLMGVSGALGSIRLANAGRTAIVDLSGAQTIQDVRNLIEGTGLGVRVRVNSAGTGIDIVNEVSAGSGGALSISEVAGQGHTATRLGIRSLSGATRVSDLNFGRGVQVVDGVINQSTGIYDQALNDDIEITLGEGTKVRIDLRPSDLSDMQSLLSRINTQLASALTMAGLDPTDLVATIPDGANGIALVQNATFPDPISVRALNNSKAAEQLGLLNTTYDFGSATLRGEDRAKVRVDDLFTRLIDLRDALRANDTSGITLAGEGLDATIASLVETRGTVGGYARRVDDAEMREVERATTDTKARSDLRDVDFTEASSRFALLQTQLEAGLRITALTQSRSLLDFLG
ncbi:MAG TPA: flagellin [Phycisphaerales bacterium]|nr:flagellin [Phycisphaerales bacterium]